MHSFIINNIHIINMSKYKSQKNFTFQNLQYSVLAETMENEERAHQDAHFQEELDGLKESVVHLTGLLEQALRNL